MDYLERYRLVGSSFRVSGTRSNPSKAGGLKTAIQSLLDISHDS